MKPWERVRGDHVAWGVLAIALLAPLPGLMRFTGPPMEEGFMLVFPQLVAAGKVPNVDFLHLYGPGSLWVLAAIYKVFGASLEVQRLVGWAQHGALVAGLYVLIRPWSRVMATGAALVALVQVITPVGLTALAWDGAIALAVWALVLATASLDAQAAGPQSSTTRWVRWRPAAAGLLGGLALLYRPDLILAVGLSLGLVWWLLASRDRALLAAGAAAGVAPMLVQLALAGPMRSINGMVLDPVLRLRGGRSLPTPPSTDELASTLQRAAALRTNGWPFPQPSYPMQVALWFWALVLGSVAVVGIGAALWRNRADPRTARFLSFGLLAVGVVPQALQRPDTTHLAWVGCLTLPALIVALAELTRGRGWVAGDWRWRGRAIDTNSANRWAPALIALAIGGGLVVSAPQYTSRTYIDLVGQGAGVNRTAVKVARGDRHYYYGDPQRAADLQAAIDALDELAEPGQRLVVGTGDLRLTPYSDAIVYWMFPELVPGTYFIEMDPGIANLAGNGLAEDVQAADWVLQTRFWDDWDEPNDSANPGDPRPNEVLVEQFCAVLERPTVTLSRRCP
ncbi:MAG: hypothetical protein R2754_14715 [Microthrixaceae bacterium]